METTWLKTLAGILVLAVLLSLAALELAASHLRVDESFIGAADPADGERDPRSNMVDAKAHLRHRVWLSGGDTRDAAGSADGPGERRTVDQ